jgi:hypothetical protein
VAVVSTEAETPTASAGRVDPSKKSAAERRTASLQSPVLYFESKRKLLELLSLFADHGYVSLEEVAAAVDRSPELGSSIENAALRERIRGLEAALRETRLANDLARWEQEEAELALASERDLVKESLVRIAALEGQLKDARRTTLKLIAASRNGLATLKRVRDHLAMETYAVGTLTPLVRDFRELTQVVQELHALAIVKASTAPLQAGRP